MVNIQDVTTYRAKTAIIGRMKARNAPWIVVCLLVTIIAFFLGTRYGQQVEQVNKLSAEVMKQIPTYFPTPSPTTKPLPPVFEQYSDVTSCQISILKEKTWKPERESSRSAILSFDDTPLVAYSCADANPFSKDMEALSPTKTKWGDLNTVTYTDSQRRTVYAIVATDTDSSVYLRMHSSVAALVAKTFSHTPAK